VKKHKQQKSGEQPGLNRSDLKESGPYKSEPLSVLESLSEQELHRRIIDLQAQVDSLSGSGSDNYLSHELQVHQVELEMQNRELREAQQALEITRDRYADLYDFAPVSYIAFDSKGIIKNINLTGACMLDQIRSGIIGRPFLKWVTGDNVNIFFHHLKDTLQSGKKADEIQIRTRDRSLMDVRIESIRSWDKEENAFICQSAILDISEHKRAQNEISLQARQLRLITDSLPALMAYINVEEQHLFANKAYLDCFGVLSAKLSGKNASGLWGEKNYSTINPYLKIAFYGQRVNFDMELQLDGVKKKYVNTTLIPDFDINNVVHGVNILIEDITERLSDEEINRERLLSAAHFSRLSTMGELASEIAHELNQPLAAISIYTDACRRMIESNKAEPEAIIQTLKDISDQTVRAGEVIRHIRAFVSKKELQLVNASLNELVNEALQLLKVELRSHEVTLTVNLASNLLLTFLDRILIEQVILNLSRNAIEAMDDIEASKRLLKIETFMNKGKQIEFRIEDSGPGLTATEIKRIFEPFHTTKKNGMGLGLAISHSIVEAHHGHLWAIPNDQGGTIFCFTLPVVVEEKNRGK